MGLGLGYVGTATPGNSYTSEVGTATGKTASIEHSPFDRACRHNDTSFKMVSAFMGAFSGASVFAARDGFRTGS